MHPMSALYHIPGADSPQLPAEANWPPSAQAFVACCLQKDPTQRWPAARLIVCRFPDSQMLMERSAVCLGETDARTSCAT